MTKEEKNRAELIARLFIGSFRTKITKVILSGELDGSGGTVEACHRREVVFFNHSEYEKKKFSNDFKKFATRLIEIYGNGAVSYRAPAKGASSFKTRLYKWDPEYVIKAEGIEFRMGRKMFNEPHAILDGCNHTYYVDINNFDIAEDIVKEINRLNNERLEREELEKINAWPEKEKEALSQCNEMIERLKSIVAGDIEITRNNIGRIDSAYIQICGFIKPD